MNKLFFRLSLLILIAGVGFVSCTKEDLKNPDQIALQSRKKSDFSIDCSSKSSSDENKLNLNTPRTIELIEMYVSGSIGIEEQDYDINRQTLALSLALREQITDKFKNLVISKALKVPSNTVNLKELIEELGVFDETAEGYSCIMSNFRTINRGLEEKDFNSFIGILDRKGDDTYNQVIYLINAKTMDKNLEPIFSSNLYINKNDEIVGWQKDERGIFNELIISEDDLANLKNPLFLMDILPTSFSEDYYAEYLSDLERSKSVKIDTRSIKKIASNRYKDCRDYDNGDEEFYCTIVGLTPSCELKNIKPKLKIAVVDEDDKCDDLFKWVGHDSFFSSHTDIFMWLNYYERDWNRHEKYLGRGRRLHPVGNYWKTVRLYGCRHHTNEWLLQDPGDQQGTTDYLSRLNTEYYNNGGWLLTPSCAKMSIDLWRVD